MNNNHEYSLYSRINDFSSYTEKYIINNIPSIYRHLRIKLIDEIYLLPRYMFYSSFNKGNIRMKNLTELQVSISMIDMYLLRLRDIPSIKKHNIDVSVSKLSSIKNIIYGWRIKEEKNK